MPQQQQLHHNYDPNNNNNNILNNIHGSSNNSAMITSAGTMAATAMTDDGDQHMDSSIRTNSISGLQSSMMNFRFGHSDPYDPVAWQMLDFELLETLGTGTFGRVKLCRHKSTGQYFAIKILHKSDIIRLKQVEHITSEKNVLAMIDCPFIVRLYKTFQDEYDLYMIQEYVVGGELFSHLRKVGKFPNDVAKFYAAEIILAIEYLHSKNIAYRDLKPENILLDSEGHVKLTDFGFAKVVMDRTWTLCGTPEYLAPEIIQSKGHGKAVDWWALGILIYEMLVGYPPFFDDVPYKIYEKILAGRIEFPRFIDASAKDLIRKLLTTEMKRLGNLKNAAMDVKRHKWFRGVDWDELYNRMIPSPIPVKISFEGDSRYYETYPEQQSQPGMSLSSEEQRLFEGF